MSNVTVTENILDVTVTDDGTLVTVRQGDVISDGTITAANVDEIVSISDTADKYIKTTGLSVEASTLSNDATTIPRSDVVFSAVSSGDANLNAFAADPSSNVSFAAAEWVSDLSVYTIAQIDAYFADPSTNASFSASEWRTDLSVYSITQIDDFFDDPSTNTGFDETNWVDVLARPVQDVTSTAYTVLVTDNTKLITVDDDTAGATVTITLLAAATAGSGFRVTVKKTGTTADVIIDGDGSETIDGGTTATLSAQYEAITLICNGTNWLIT